MTGLMRAWSAEVLKTKRTLMLTLAFVAPLSVVFLEFIARMQHGDGLARSTAMNEWLSTAQNISILWGMLVLPLFVTLETGLLGSLEHSNKTWKELYALPIPRWAV